MKTAPASPEIQGRTPAVCAARRKHRESAGGAPGFAEEDWLVKIVWEQEGHGAGSPEEYRREVHLQWQATHHLLERELPVAL